jgi:RNA-directed DNA polymerase
MPLVFDKKTLVAALGEVRRNHGVPGVDGESVEEFSENAEARLQELSEALRKHEWHPKPLKRVWIPKPDGSKRGLAVPCVEDRVVHRAVAKVVYSVFENAFGPDCYAYVKGRSALDAVQRIQREGRSGKGWVFESDLSKFFDTIPRSRLIDKLAVRIADGSFLKLVRSILRSGVLGEESGDGAVGVPQGSPLSPILANVYLAAFDRKLGRHHSFVRYADDIVALCATEEEARATEREMGETLWEEGLKLKPEKTHIVRLSEGVEFLGYRITAWKAEPSTKSVRKFREKIRSMTERHRTKPLAEVIRQVMPVVRGWSNYFRLAGRSPVVYSHGGWLITRLKAYETESMRVRLWERYCPTSKLYGLGLRVPYHIVTSYEF